MKQTVIVTGLISLLTTTTPVFAEQGGKAATEEHQAHTDAMKAKGDEKKQAKPAMPGDKKPQGIMIQQQGSSGPGSIKHGNN